MKKFLFSLQKVLGFKQQMLDIQINELAQLESKRLKIEHEMNEISNQFSKANQSMIDKLENGLSANTAFLYKTYMETLNDKTLKLLDVKEQLLRVIFQKKREIIALKSEISGLDKLKNKQYKEYCENLRKVQELAVEEFVGQARIRVNT